MVPVVANAAKQKGDRAELEAVRMLQELVPDLCVEGAQRMLGAGRSEDVGDLHVFRDVAIQVRNYAKAQIGGAVRSSAKDAVIQARNGRVSLGLGLVPYPRAVTGTVRWLACVEEWPGGADALPIEPVPFAMISKALDWVRDDAGPHGYMAYPREQRIAVLAGGTTTPVIIAPIEAWLAAYRQVIGVAAPLPTAVEEQAEESVILRPVSVIGLADVPDDEFGSTTGAGGWEPVYRRQADGLSRAEMA